MIKCDLGTVKIEGKKSIVKAELSTLIFSFKENEILTKEEIKECVDRALSCDCEDIEKQYNKVVSDILDSIKDILLTPSKET